jgi:thymidylate kinase
VIHPLLEAVFRAFDQADIHWCVLRGADHLDAPADGIVLLVARSDIERVRQILEGLEFAALPALGRGSGTSFLDYHLPTDQWIKLDIVTELSYGPYFSFQTRAEMGCLARRQRVGEIFALDPDDAFWTLLLHCLLDKGAFAAHHAARLEALVGAARADGPLARIVDAVCPPGWHSERMMAYVRAGDWSTLAQNGSQLASAYARRQPFRTQVRTLVNRALRLTERLLVPVHRRGLAVALLGPDGVGKSTLAAGLQDSFYFPVRSVYMGLWQRSPARSVWLRLPGLELAARPFKIWGRYLTAQYHRVLGRLVVFDRYVYDATLPPRPPLVAAKRLYFWLLARTCPTPDLVLVLDAPGQVMYERKGESTAASLEAERQHFLALRQRIAQLQVVDATRPADAVRVDVVDRIWRRQAAHWRKNL